MSTDYADWTPDELRAEIAALVITVERLERDRDGLRQEWHKVNDARRRNAIENTRLRSALHRMTEQATEAGIACMEIEGRYHELEDERTRLRAVVDALREWQKARERLLIADSPEDEDRATDALDVAGQVVLAKLQELDEAKEVTDGG